MSRKKREERIRAAETAKADKATSSTAGQLDQMAAGFGDVTKATSWYGKLIGVVIGNKAVLIGVIMVLGAGIGLGLCQFGRYRLRNVAGTPTGELVVTSPQGDTVILLDHVAIGGNDSKGRSQQATATGKRLTAIDARTGEQLAVELTEYSTCWAGGPRVWCLDEYRRVILLDPRTLATVASTADLIAAANLAKPIDRHDVVGADVIVHLSDGRGAQISPATLAVSVLETIPWQMPRTSADGCADTSRVSDGGTTLVLDSGTRNKLTSDPPPPAESPVPAGPALTFLDGGFLITDAPQPIVLHRATVGGPQILTRVDGISRARWTFPLEGVCRHARPAGDSLIVIIDNPGRRAVAINPETGGLRWEFGR